MLKRQAIYMEDLFTGGIFASFDYFAHQHNPAMSQLLGTYKSVTLHEHTFHSSLSKLPARLFDECLKIRPYVSGYITCFYGAI